MDFRADLHIHTHFSDGTNTPEEILHLAKKNNLSGLAITDHDTMAAYSDKLFNLAKDLDLQLMSGVEVSSELLNVSVHILGYNIDLSYKPFQDFLIKVQEKRNLRNIEILKKLNEKNIEISSEELAEFIKRKNIAKSVVGRVHIAQLMLEKGYVDSFIEAFSKYIKDDGPCYVHGSKFSCEKVIDQIHLAKGKAIIAHPSVFKSSRTLRTLLEHNFDGIEVYYAKLLPQDERRWERIANEKNLIATGGSDFHGTVKPYLSVGCSWVNEETFNRLLSE